ncbi:MAG: phosphoglucomutase (alpha-D-glucose-1,6-bisphosphate-dependent) [Actinomycetes bacterium]
MANHPRAGTPALPQDLADIAKLVNDYYVLHPDVSIAEQRVSFGTSGHRGSSFDHAFNEDHIAATTQAIVEYRTGQQINGPLFMGMDTHALSEPAYATALEVLAANGIEVRLDPKDSYVPTPVISHAILRYNNGSNKSQADGIVITPSHNPPSNGGFKYNPPDGGPAGTEITSWIQDRANEILKTGLRSVKRIPYEKARLAPTTRPYDYLETYVDDLPNVINVDAIREAGIRIGADPLGGASVYYWGAIAERLNLDITVVNTLVDRQFAFMTLDWDGKIRMDCSSPSAMASMVAHKDDYQISTGNDTDSDRHGIVTPDAGLMNPNHYLAVAIQYLFANRPGWPEGCAVGKTLVSSSMIDRVAQSLGRKLIEVPVGFKWFVPGLVSGTIGFGGEESAGASFLRLNGKVWTTDKDGIIPALLASEILAVTGKTPSQHYHELTERFGDPAYARVDAPATPAEKATLAGLSPEQVTATDLAGEPITAKLTRAPGNDAPIGGLKVTTESAWFAARPSGTENVYKIYAESFKGPEHLALVQEQAREVVSDALKGS